jgi:hypothetical protein
MVLLMPLAATDRAWADRFLAALDFAHISQKAAAIAMGITEPQLTRALKAEPGANLFLKRVEALPPAFHQEYAALLAVDYGLPERFVQGAQMALIIALGGAKRMASMVLDASPRLASRERIVS